MCFVQGGSTVAGEAIVIIVTKTSRVWSVKVATIATLFAAAAGTSYGQPSPVQLPWSVVENGVEVRDCRVRVSPKGEVPPNRTLTPRLNLPARETV